MSEPDLDVVVFGATGVTGRRVAAYLFEQSLLCPKRSAFTRREAISSVVAPFRRSGSKPAAGD